MALTTAQQVRLMIQDQPRMENKTYTADGRATAYNVPHLAMTTGSAYVLNANGAWSATGATFVSGHVAFGTAISANSGFLLTYTHSVFSDDEIDHFTAQGRSVKGAALEAIQALMFDSLKRSRWQSPDGTMFDDTKAQDTLQKMYDRFRNEIQDDSIAGGGIYSWGADQI